MRQGLAEQGRQRENHHLGWSDHTPTHYLELKFEAVSPPKFVASRGTEIGGVDWAEDISSWATGDSSFKRQVSFMKIARAETYCLSLMEVSLTEATQAPQRRGCREVLQHSSL